MKNSQIYTADYKLYLQWSVKIIKYNYFKQNASCFRGVRLKGSMASHTPRKYNMKIGVTKEVLDTVDMRIKKIGFKNRTDLLYFLLMNYLKEAAHEYLVNREIALLSRKEKQQNELK